MKRVRLDKTGEVFSSLCQLANHLGVKPQYVVWCKNYKADRSNHFFYKDLGITILEHKKDYPVIAKEKRLELALKKIISMEQRICIDPLGEIIDDILAIAKHALNKPVI